MSHRDNTQPPSNTQAQPSVADTAHAARAAGLVALPVAANGTKAPDVPGRLWNHFKERLPTDDEHRDMAFELREGLGLVAGAISRLDCIDFDDNGVFEDSMLRAHASGLGALVDRLVAGYLDRTPGGGRRLLVYYPAGLDWKPMKFAQRPGRPELGEGVFKTLIELPAFAVIAPSHGRTHKTGRPYEHLSGDITTIASYTADERRTLMDLWRSFDERAVPDASPPRQTTPRPPGSPERPGDTFMRCTTWPELLTRAGWTHVYDRGEISYWRRPGKEWGVSASTNAHGKDKLHVFSTSTEFSTDHSYDRFAFYTVLEHGGNFSKAASALRKLGYGSRAGHPDARAHTTEDTMPPASHTPPLELVRTATGTPRPTLDNVVTILQQDPVWHAGVLWYDAFLDTVFFGYDGPARPWRDEDAYTLTIYMQSTHEMHTVSDGVVLKAAMLVARQRTRHCVREWLLSLVWDGHPRIHTAFTDYWGAAQDAYTCSASYNFFVGLVARIQEPGCKLDTMVVFEGPQGIKKSSALQVLGGPWYGITHERVGTKDFLQGLRGLLLLEIGELQSFSKAEVSAVKNMLSAPHDDYRASYGRSVTRYPRSCVFAGTTNADEWGTDDTGLRRFWPIQCGVIDLEALRADRDQLFAEALLLHEFGASWWEMPAAETLEVQADRMVEHAWIVPLSAALMGQTSTTVHDCLVTHLQFHESQITTPAQMQVGAVLRLLGWRKKIKRGVTGRQAKRWFKDEV